MKFLYKSETIDYTFISGKTSILFLHGWGGNKFSFLSTMNLLKNNYGILSVTLPTVSPTPEVWTLSDYVTLIENILKLHNIKNSIVICHSFGFRVATLLKEKIRIEKLIVTGGAGPKKINKLKTIEQQNNSILLANKKFKFLYDKLASADYKTLNNTNKITFKNVVNFNTINLLKFNCPILLFWGKHDTSTKLWIAKKIKAQNKAKLINTNSNHFAYLNLNTQFNHEVLKFLKE